MSEIAKRIKWFVLGAGSAIVLTIVATPMLTRFSDENKLAANKIGVRENRITINNDSTITIMTFVERIQQELKKVTKNKSVDKGSVPICYALGLWVPKEGLDLDLIELRSDNFISGRMIHFKIINNISQSSTEQISVGGFSDGILSIKPNEIIKDKKNFKLTTEQVKDVKLINNDSIVERIKPLIKTSGLEIEILNKKIIKTELNKNKLVADFKINSLLVGKNKIQNRSDDIFSAEFNIELPKAQKVTITVDTAKFQAAFGNLSSIADVVKAFNKLTFAQKAKYLIIKNNKNEIYTADQVLTDVILKEDNTSPSKIKFVFTNKNEYEIIDETESSLKPIEPTPPVKPEEPVEPQPETPENKPEPVPPVKPEEPVDPVPPVKPEEPNVKPDESKPIEPTPPVTTEKVNIKVETAKFQAAFGNLPSFADVVKTFNELPFDQRIEFLIIKDKDGTTIPAKNVLSDVTLQEVPDSPSKIKFVFTNKNGYEIIDETDSSLKPVEPQPETPENKPEPVPPVKPEEPIEPTPPVKPEEPNVKPDESKPIEPTPPVTTEKVNIKVETAKFQAVFGNLPSFADVVKTFNELPFDQRIEFLIIKDKDGTTIPAKNVLSDVTLQEVPNSPSKIKFVFTNKNGYEIIDETDSSLKPTDPVPPVKPEEPNVNPDESKPVDPVPPIKPEKPVEPQPENPNTNPTPDTGGDQPTPPVKPEESKPVEPTPPINPDESKPTEPQPETPENKPEPVPPAETEKPSVKPDESKPVEPNKPSEVQPEKVKTISYLSTNK